MVKNSICSTQTNRYSYTEIILYIFIDVSRIIDEMHIVVKYKCQKGIQRLQSKEVSEINHVSMQTFLFYLEFI